MCKKRFHLFLKFFPDVLFNEDPFFFHIFVSLHTTFVIKKHKDKATFRRHTDGKDCFDGMLSLTNKLLLTYSTVSYPHMLHIQRVLFANFHFHSSDKNTGKCTAGLWTSQFEENVLAGSFCQSICHRHITHFQPKKREKKKNKYFSPLKQSECFCYDIISLWKWVKLGISVLFSISFIYL